MSEASRKTPRFRFGPFELDPDLGTLTRDGARVKLQDLPYRLLVMLVERPGEVITRDEVRQRLWPENTFVEFDNSLGVAVRKVRDALHDDAEAPHYVETIPKRGYRFLAPVKIQVPETPASAEMRTVGQVHSIATNQPVDHSPVPRRANRPWFVAGLVVLIVGGVIFGFRSVAHRIATKAEASPLHVRRAVAVLGFRNLPGRSEDNWLSPAFSEMLNTELAAGGALRMVSGEDVARAKRELPVTDEDSLARATLERLRTNPGADIIILGSYTLLPENGRNRIRLDLRAQDTARGDTIAEQAFTGSEDDLFEMATQAGQALRQSLGVSSLSSEATNALRAALPANEQAARLYAQGRAKLWEYDFLGARDLLLKAAVADPNYPLVHSALSESLWHIGYGVKARAEAQRARDLSGHLSEEQRLLVEGQYQRTLSNWPKAMEAYQSLFRLFPDSLDYGLLLASAQMYVNRADSLHTLAILRALPPPERDDARIDMAEASAWINTDFVKGRAAAKLAIAKATAQGSHAVVARTYAILCQQEPSMGASADAIGDCENALQSSVADKDYNGAAMMRSNLAAIHYEMGDLALSEKMFRAAIEEFRRVGNPDAVATDLSNLGGALLTAGDLNAARKLLEQAIPQYQAVEDKEGVALALNNLGDLSWQSGDLAVAETTFQQARSTAEEIDDKNAIAFVLNGLGDVYTDRGDLAAARKSYEQSLTLRDQVGEKQAAAETQVGLARLAIEEGHAAEAEASARKYRDQFKNDNQADDEVSAITVLIDALLAQGRPAEAQKEVESGKQLAAKRENRLIRLQFDLATARATAVSGEPESSRALLGRVLGDARSHGFRGVEFEARLALCDLDATVGKKADARALSASLERDAHAKGFGLIARKAAEKSISHGAGSAPIVQ